MQFCEINPYIRFAAVYPFHTSDGTVRAYDCRLFFALTGESRLFLGERSYPVKPDTLLLLPAGIPYRILVPKQTEWVILNFDYDCLHIGQTEMPPSRVEQYCEDRLLPQPLFDDAPALNEPLILYAPFARERLKEIVTEKRTGRIHASAKASAILKDILTDVLRASSFSGGAGKRIVDRVIGFICAHYQEELTNTTLGQAMGYHSYYINRLMLASTGSTLRQYLIHVRLEHAVQLLLNTDLTVEQISEACGFSTSAYFSNCFKARTGVSPTQYRVERKNLF